VDHPARDRARAGRGGHHRRTGLALRRHHARIRRDLQALEESGFPLCDDKTREDGKTRWRVNGQAFKGLSAGLTVWRRI
jgi:hypothetical protein